MYDRRHDSWDGVPLRDRPVAPRFAHPVIAPAGWTRSTCATTGDGSGAGAGGSAWPAAAPISPTSRQGLRSPRLEEIPLAVASQSPWREAPSIGRDGPFRGVCAGYRHVKARRALLKSPWAGRWQCSGWLFGDGELNLSAWVRYGVERLVVE